MDVATPARFSHLVVHPSPSSCKCRLLTSHSCSLLWITALSQIGITLFEWLRTATLVPWTPVASGWEGDRKGQTPCLKVEPTLLCSFTDPMKSGQNCFLVETNNVLIYVYSHPHYILYPSAENRHSENYM